MAKNGKPTVDLTQAYSDSLKVIANALAKGTKLCDIEKLSRKADRLADAVLTAAPGKKR